MEASQWTEDLSKTINKNNQEFKFLLIVPIFIWSLLKLSRITQFHLYFYWAYIAISIKDRTIKKKKKKNEKEAFGEE